MYKVLQDNTIKQRLKKKFILTDPIREKPEGQPHPIDSSPRELQPNAHGLASQLLSIYEN